MEYGLLISWMQICMTE